MKYVIGGAFIVIIVAGLIAGVLSIASPDSTPETSTETTTAISYAEDDSEVIYTEYGGIVADEEYRAIRITVSAQARTIEILSGYDLVVADRSRLPNTSRAYEAFLHALDTTGFSEAQTGAPEREDGVCPSGKRYVFEAVVDGETDQRTWTTSCSRSEGSFAGNRSRTARLFEDQIPEYRDFVRDTRL